MTASNPASAAHSGRFGLSGNPILARVRCPDCGRERTADLRARYWKAVLSRPLAFFDSMVHHAYIVTCDVCARKVRAN